MGVGGGSSSISAAPPSVVAGLLAVLRAAAATAAAAPLTAPSGPPPPLLTELAPLRRRADTATRGGVCSCGGASPRAEYGGGSRCGETECTALTGCCSCCCCSCCCTGSASLGARPRAVSGGADPEAVSAPSLHREPRADVIAGGGHSCHCCCCCCGTLSCAATAASPPRRRCCCRWETRSTMMPGCWRESAARAAARPPA